VRVSADSTAGEQSKRNNQQHQIINSINGAAEAMLLAITAAATAAKTVLKNSNKATLLGSPAISQQPALSSCLLKE